MSETPRRAWIRRSQTRTPSPARSEPTPPSAIATSTLTDDATQPMSSPPSGVEPTNTVV